MTMGEYIKKLRIEHGWSQEELGRMLGVNRAAVNKWEVGTVENIKRSTIRDLSRLFGVTPCELMQWEDTPEVKPSCQLFEPCQASNAQDTIKRFLQLDAIDQAKIAERIEMLLEADKYNVEKGLRNA